MQVDLKICLDLQTGKYLISSMHLLPLSPTGWRWMFAASAAIIMSTLPLGGCGQPSSEKSAGVVVESWGPKQTVEGKGFNIQPGGESAMWIKATGLPDGRAYKVKIGDFEAQPVRRTASGVGTAVPAALLTSVGSHRVMLLDDATGAETLVGTFEVLPANR